MIERPCHFKSAFAFEFSANVLEYKNITLFSHRLKRSQFFYRYSRVFRYGKVCTIRSSLYQERGWFCLLRGSEHYSKKLYSIAHGYHVCLLGIRRDTV